MGGKHCGKTFETELKSALEFYRFGKNIKNKECKGQLKEQFFWVPFQANYYFTFTIRSKILVGGSKDVRKGTLLGIYCRKTTKFNIF